MDKSLEQHIREVQERKEMDTEIQEALRTLTKYLNRMNTEDKVANSLFDALVREHRTLQQSFWKSMFSVISQYSGIRYDLRNEGSVNACKRLTEVLEDTHLPYV